MTTRTRRVHFYNEHLLNNNVTANTTNTTNTTSQLNNNILTAYQNMSVSRPLFTHQDIPSLTTLPTLQFRLMVYQLLKAGFANAINAQIKEVIAKIAIQQVMLHDTQSGSIFFKGIIYPVDLDQINLLLYKKLMTSFIRQNEDERFVHRQLQKLSTDGFPVFGKITQEYAEHWKSRSELCLLPKIAQLVEHHLTPHVILNFYARMTPNILNENLPVEMSSQIQREWKHLPKSHTYDATFLLGECSNGQTLHDCQFNQKTKGYFRYMMHIIVQVMYTLLVMDRAQITHYDLNVSNVFLDQITESFFHVMFVSENEYIVLPFSKPKNNLYVRLFDWDFGYSPECHNRQFDGKRLQSHYTSLGICPQQQIQADVFRIMSIIFLDYANWGDDDDDDEDNDNNTPIDPNVEKWRNFFFELFSTPGLHHNQRNIGNDIWTRMMNCTDETCPDENYMFWTELKEQYENGNVVWKPIVEQFQAKWCQPPMQQADLSPLRVLRTIGNYMPAFAPRQLRNGNQILFDVNFVPGTPQWDNLVFAVDVQTRQHVFNQLIQSQTNGQFVNQPF